MTMRDETGKSARRPIARRNAQCASKASRIEFIRRQWRYLHRPDRAEQFAAAMMDRLGDCAERSELE
jgi:hypothetical protein